MTPAEESVCDGLDGAAYGLCIAYCEALDCDSEFPSASGNACGSVLANFEKKTGGMPPCLTVNPCDAVDDNPDNQCPCNFFDVPMTEECWIPSDTAANIFSPCRQDNCLTADFIDSCSINTRIPAGPVQIEFVRMQARQFDGVYRCASFVDSPELCMGVQTEIVDDITETQFLACLCRIEQYADELEDVADIDIANGDPPFSCTM